MVKDLVDEVEPKGIPVPLGDTGDPNKKPKRTALTQLRDVVIPKKRLKAQHRKEGAGLSLKTWVKKLKEPSENKLAQQWLEGKRRSRGEKQDKG